MKYFVPEYLIRAPSTTSTRYLINRNSCPGRYSRPTNHPLRALYPSNNSIPNAPRRYKVPLNSISCINTRALPVFRKRERETILWKSLLLEQLFNRKRVTPRRSASCLCGRDTFDVPGKGASAGQISYFERRNVFRLYDEYRLTALV